MKSSYKENVTTSLAAKNNQTPANVNEVHPINIDQFVKERGSDIKRVNVKLNLINKIVKRKAREAALITRMYPGRRYDPIRRTVQYFDIERKSTYFNKTKYKECILEYFSQENLNFNDIMLKYLEVGHFNSKLERLQVLDKLSKYRNRLAHKFPLNNLTFNQYEHYFKIYSEKKEHYFIVDFFQKVRLYDSNRFKKSYIKNKLRSDRESRNRFILLEVEPCSEVRADCEFDYPTHNRVYNPTTILKYHIDTTSVSELESICQQYQDIDSQCKYYFKTTVDMCRDLDLLNKLRAKIQRLVNIRVGNSHLNEVSQHSDLCFEDICLDEIQPEMMEDSTPSTQQSSGPVVLNTLESDETIVSTEKVNNDFWIHSSTSDTIVDLKHASAMEILAKQFIWSSDWSSNYNIFNMDLPSDALVNNMNHPAAMMFGQYAYWNGDMRVRIHINTTPFHIGQLIFSWYYASHFDGNYEHRNNIASSIQLPHVFFNASEGNDAVLTIPFRNYRSMLCTRKKKDDSLPLYMGTLRCHVFNPLTLPVKTEVSGYVHVNFENNHFTGIIPRRSVQPEMMPTKSLIKTAEGVLNIIDKCTNMDKPSNPALPIMQTPQFMDSMASGINDLSNVHMLRLDPHGQTQHPLGSSTTNQETNIKDISRRWGFLRSVTWKDSQNRGTVLYRLPVSPELDYNSYYSTSIRVGDVSRTGYVLPPVSVISSINAYNRGSLEYKFQIINSKYHAGALLASFTPVMYSVSLDDAIQSYNTTFDIGNISEYVFKVPYINERPYNPRFNRVDSNDDDPLLAPIGELNLYVLNQLRNVTGAADHVYVNIFIRAGEDFEVAVPVPPLYTVLYDTAPPAVKEYITLDVSQTAVITVGLDNWRYATQCPSMAVIKDGTAPDAMMRFNFIKPFTVYKQSYVDSVNNYLSDPFTVHQYLYPLGNTREASNTLQFICMYITNGDGNKYKYGITFSNEQDADNYCRTWATLRTSENAYPNSPDAKYWQSIIPGVQTGYLVATEGSYRTLHGPASGFRWIQHISYFNRRIIEPQGNDGIIDPTLSTLMNMDGGLKLFGEKFTDLKDYCRRYQPYGGITMNIAKAGKGHLARIPLTPIGLRLSSVNSALITRTREGMIPFVASAFRFYRGSLRFKVVISGLNKNNNLDGEVIYIQHKPDIVIDTRNITSYDLDLATRASLLLQSGYAYSALSMSVNNSLNVEIPFYCPTNLLMLQSPDFTRKAETIHYALGVLDIYMTSPIAKDNTSYYIQLHYALADDMDLSCFVGFPPMVPLYESRLSVLGDDFQHLNIQPEMNDVDSIQTDTDYIQARAIADAKIRSDNNVIPEGRISDIKSSLVNKLSATRDKIENHAFSIAYARARKELELSEAGHKNPDSIMSIIKDLVVKVGKQYAHIIYSCISQIVHCINYPTMSTFAITFVTICSHLGFEMFDKIELFAQWFANLFKHNNVTLVDEVAHEVVPEMAADNKTEISAMETKNSIISLIVRESAKFMGLVWSGLVGIPKFISLKFFDGLGKISSAINQFIRLIQNLCTVIPDIFNWLGKKFRASNWLKWYLHDQGEFVNGWMSDVEYVTDPNIVPRVKSSVKYVNRIELLVMVGRDIVRKVRTTGDHYAMPYLLSLLKKLETLYVEIAGKYSGAGSIGIEPFCFCLYGRSQVGKTFVTKTLASACLKAIDYTSEGELFYTRGAQKHWDGLENEPICILDDFGHILEAGTCSEYVAEFLHLKSKATFAPPRADIADKGKKYSPLIVAMTMNEPFSKFTSVVSTPVAWQSRRDVLIHTIYTPPTEYANLKVDQLPESITSEYKHLRFQINEYNNVGYEGDEKDVTRMKTLNLLNDDGKVITTDTLTYKQLLTYLTTTFVEKYSVMKRQYAKDFALHMSFQPKHDDSFERNVNKYIEHLKTVHRQLNSQEVDMIGKIVSIDKCLQCGFEKLSCMCNVNLFKTSMIGTLAPKGVDNSSGIQAENSVEKYDFDKEFKSHNGNANNWIIHLLDKFPFANSPHNRWLYQEYIKFRKNIADNTVPNRVIGFFNCPCIHTYTNAVSMPEFFLSEDTDKEWFFLVDEAFYPVNPEKCKCYIDKYLDMAIYRRIIRRDVYALYGEGIDLPVYLREVSKLKTIDEKYKRFMDEKKLALVNLLKRPVEKKTWMGEKAYVLIEMLSKFAPALVIIGLFSTFTLWKYSDRASDKEEQVKIKQDINKLRAAQILAHKPSVDCLAGCTMCDPEMAYDHNKILNAKPRKVIMPKHIVRPEMATEIKESLLKKLKRNTFFIVAITSDNTMVASRCVGIRDRWFIAVDHYFDKFRSLPADTVFYFKHSNFETKLGLHEIEIQNIKDSAILLCRLPNRVSAFADILSKFASASVIPNMNPDAALIVVEHEDTMRKIQEYQIMWYREQVKLHDDTLHIPHVVSKDYPYTTVGNYWSYATSGRGFCGSVLISRMNTTAPIIGIHVAGDKRGGRGYAEVVCFETLNNILSNYDIRVKDVELEGQMFDGKFIEFSDDITKARSVLTGDVGFIGIVPNKVSFRPSPDSKCLHSMCYNKITSSTYDFPHLSPKDERFVGSPMVNGCMHHTSPPLSFDKNDMEVIISHVKEVVIAKVKPLRNRVGVLSINQAIEGIHNIPGYDAMEFDTSEGFPFLSIRPKGSHDKKWLFDLDVTDEGYIVKSINNVLIDVMNDKYEKRKNKIVPMTVFTDCLKDMKLPKEKCDRTRIFSVSPVDFTIQFRQYFYDFTVAFQEARFNVESAVGINVDSYEWNELVHLLLENSEHFVCGDYSKFGPRLMSTCVQAFFDIIIEWYKINGDDSEENAIVRYIMGQEIAFSKHLMLNFVYETYCGAPSGCPITTILNNGVNMMYIRMAYMHLNKDKYLLEKVRDISFMRNVRVVFYGDDLVMTVKSNVLSWFNANTISSFFSKYDIKFTNSLKQDIFSNSANVFSPETTFLKRNIVRHPFRPIFVGAMDIRAIEETCNWVFKGHEEPEASILACEAMLLNAHGHGPKYYNNLRSKVMEFWRLYYILPNIPLWREVDSRIFEEEPLIK